MNDLQKKAAQKVVAASLQASQHIVQGMSEAAVQEGIAIELYWTERFAALLQGATTDVPPENREEGAQIARHYAGMAIGALQRLGLPREFILQFFGELEQQLREYIKKYG